MQTTPQFIHSAWIGGGGQDDAKKRGLSLSSIMQQSGWRSIQTAIMYENKRDLHNTAAAILREQNHNQH